jgi:hypothetical protein
MIELRKAERAQGQLSLGWRTPREIADKMKSFATAATVSLARHTLVLHSGPLPADLDEAKTKLDAYVDSVLRELPVKLPDHVLHPIFAYHHPTFHRARREYLVRRRGG